MPTVDINQTANIALIVANPTSQYGFIRVWAFDFVANGATNVSLTGTDNVTYWGPQNYTPAGAGLVKGGDASIPAFDLPKGVGLNLKQDSGVQIGGSLQYQVVMN